MGRQGMKGVRKVEGGTGRGGYETWHVIKGNNARAIKGSC
jgi:hypothetical protein